MRVILDILRLGGTIVHTSGTVDQSLSGDSSSKIEVLAWPAAKGPVQKFDGYTECAPTISATSISNGGMPRRSSKLEAFPCWAPVRSACARSARSRGGSRDHSDKLRGDSPTLARAAATPVSCRPFE